MLIAPIRAKNLTKLNLVRNFRRLSKAWNKTIYLILSADETKNDRDMEFQFPHHLVQLFDTYMNHHRPILLKGADEGWLFPGAKGGHKNPVSVGDQLVRAINRLTGIQINPHLYRHIAAFLYLQEYPAGYETIRLLLGHKSVDTLYALGLDLKEKSYVVDPYRPLDDSVMYRDGLMLSVLAIAPVRRKNLAQLRLDWELIRLDGAWIMIIPAEDTKNGQPFDVPLPNQISGAIDVYIRDHRPRLMNDHDTNALWVSKSGRPMSVNRVGQRISQVTKRHLGFSVSAHKFRHAAATSIAVFAPEMVSIIRPLLSHTTSHTAEKYYNKASSLSASQRVADNILSLKEDFQEPWYARRDLRKILNRYAIRDLG